MDDNKLQELLKEAKKIASQNFCCCHSNYTVGASLLGYSGKIYNGFNIENDGIQSICAERVAFGKALTENERKFIGIMVVGKNLNDTKFIKTLPCGYCRQFISEYVDSNFKVYTYDEVENKIYSYSIKELLPYNFNLQEVNNGK